MKFKDRLNLVNNTEKKKNILKDDIVIEQSLSECNGFVKDKIAEKIIKDSIDSYDNIIIASSTDCDSSVLCNYLKNYLEKDSDVIVLPNPEIKDILEIIQNIIYGQKGFIFTSRIKDYNNFIEKLKLLMLINYSNMTEKIVDKILEYLGAIVIFVSQNQDGLYYVSKIGKIKNEKNTIVLNDVYESDKISIKKETKLTEDKETPKKRVNKYKLLKEKIKKHNNIDL